MLPSFGTDRHTTGAVGHPSSGFFGLLECPAFDRQQLLDALHRLRGMLVQHRFDHRGDSGEGQPAIEEPPDGHLVGSAEYGGGRATQSSRLAGHR